jgi:hypothetical protein
MRTATRPPPSAEIRTAYFFIAVSFDLWPPPWRLKPSCGQRRLANIGHVTSCWKAVGAALCVRSERARERLFVIDDEPLRLLTSQIHQYSGNLASTRACPPHLSTTYLAAGYEAGYTGAHYAARHEPSLNQRSIALFGPPSELLVVGDAHIRGVGLKDFSAIGPDLLQRAQQDFGIQGMPTSDLW